MNPISRASLLVALSLLCASFLAGTALAQARAQFAVDVIATCQKPAMKDLPIHVEGTGILKTDGSARLDVDGGVLGRTRVKGQLGQSAAAPGGSTSLHVTGRSGLRATRDYPNHQMIIDLQVTGKECVVSVRNVLKSGKREYIFTTGGGTAYCDKPRIERTACQAF
jgi:hypothetical protein